MHATIRRYEGLSSVEEVARRLEEGGFVRLLEGIGGFVAYYLIDAGDGKLASVSVFEDQAGAEESNRIASQFVSDQLSDLGMNPPEVTAGEAVLQG